MQTWGTHLSNVSVLRTSEHSRAVKRNTVIVAQDEKPLAEDARHVWPWVAAHQRSLVIQDVSKLARVDELPQENTA